MLALSNAPFLNLIIKLNFITAAAAPAAGTPMHAPHSHPPATHDATKTTCFFNQNVTICQSPIDAKSNRCPRVNLVAWRDWHHQRAQEVQGWAALGAGAAPLTAFVSLLVPVQVLWILV